MLGKPCAQQLFHQFDQTYVIFKGFDFGLIYIEESLYFQGWYVE